MRIWGLATCDTTRRALRDLRAAGLEVDLIDVRASGLAPDVVAAMLAALGPGLVNRASATWRGLPEDQRNRAPEALLGAHPLLMKRPVISSGGRWTMGWDAATAAGWTRRGGS